MAIFKFNGGVKIESDNKLDNSQDIFTIPDPENFIIPLQQHIGNKPQTIVKVGELVSKFQLLATTGNSFGADIHAPTSGIITKIGLNPLIHPDHLSDICIFLQADGKDNCIQLNEAKPESLTKDKIVELIKSAGIVGLGGAGFPSYAKIPTINLEYLIINAAECEPYISCDDGLMQNYPEQLIAGIKIVQSLVKPKHTLVAIENNKQLAIKGLQAVTDDSIKIVAIPTIYPSGGEKQLIKILTNQNINKNQIVHNIVCYNIGTIFSIFNAVIKGRPLIERIVTVTGSACTKASNYLIKIGTPLTHILQHAGVTNYQKIISGGPLMGFAFDANDTSLKKTNNCFIVEANKKPVKISECIRCGECAEVCPMDLLPQQLYWHSHNLGKAAFYNVNNCIECACCDVVCPSNIPLAKIFVATKAEIKSEIKKHQKSDHSKVRHDNRELRLIRLEQQRQDKLAKQRVAIKLKLAQKKTDELASKQKLISAAVKRNIK